MERHQELCADAVDPLDIAEVLERSGIGPGAAGRYRHADVFSLAEEMYARVPRRAVAPARSESPWRRRARPALAIAGWLLGVALLLWALSAALGLHVPLGARIAAYAAAVALVLGRGAPLWRRALLALGLGSLLALVQGVGPPQIALTAAAGLADWCARWFRHIGWGHSLARSAREFRSRMRPVLPATAGLFLAVLAGLTVAASALPRGEGGLTAGAGTGAAWLSQGLAGTALLFTLLLWHCGRQRAALLALAGCCLSAGIARAIPAAHADVSGWACGLTAVLLLPYAWVTLLSPTSHRAPGGPSARDA
ncbi:hypothetical protein ABIA32_002123 [Streptacidiphilus sp. MAP12-20]|uniref:hypothetical protein n=1 Tax=Streptacidiphilus sp. MAP12-20 TaxID=3156299 RepID=UPI0035112117